MSTRTDFYSSEFCAFCHEGIGAPTKCRYSRTGHRFEEVTMDYRIAAVIESLNSGLISRRLDPSDAEPNFFKGIDVGPVRLCTDGYGEHLQVMAFTPDKAKVLRYKIDLDAETPLEVIAATFQAVRAEVEA